MINKVDLLGKLLNEPELKETKKGIKVCNLTLLTWKYVPKKGEDGTNRENMIKVKTKHRITCWGNRAVKAVNILKKGMLVYIDGELVRRVNTKQLDDGSQIQIPIVEIKANLIKRVIQPNSQEYQES